MPPMRQLDVLYFAALRERIDTHRESLEIDPEETATLRDVWSTIVERHPELEGLGEHLRVAVDRQVVDWDHSVANIESGAEVAFIPPVSGGAGDSTEPHDSAPQTRKDGAIAVTPHELEPADIEAYVRRPSTGGLVSFEGIVRNHTDGRPVERLVYEAYVPMAADVLEEIADKATTRWPEAQLAIHHRIGSLTVGEVAVVVAAASAHRAPSFEAVQWTIRTLKQEAPIWKKEIGADESQWIRG